MHERLPRTVFIQIVPDLDLCSSGSVVMSRSQVSRARATSAVRSARRCAPAARPRATAPSGAAARSLEWQPTRPARAPGIHHLPGAEARRDDDQQGDWHQDGTAPPRGLRRTGEPRMRRHERRAQRSRVGIAGSRILGERARDDRFSVCGRVCAHCAERRRIVAEDRADYAGIRRARERPASGQHLVDDRAREKISDRASTGRPSACSGDM